MINCEREKIEKKPSCQIPGGIFGPENEATLFDSINITDPVERMKASQIGNKEQKCDLLLHRFD